MCHLPQMEKKSFHFQSNFSCQITCLHSFALFSECHSNCAGYSNLTQVYQDLLLSSLAVFGQGGLSDGRVMSVDLVNPVVQTGHKKGPKNNGRLFCRIHITRRNEARRRVLHGQNGAPSISAVSDHYSKDPRVGIMYTF